MQDVRVLEPREPRSTTSEMLPPTLRWTGPWSWSPTWSGRLARSRSAKASLPIRPGVTARSAYSFSGAIVRLWHEPHSLRGRVVGLRPVSDGGPQALLIDDLGAYGLRAARPADGSSFPADRSLVSTASGGIPVALWPVEDSATLVAPAELPAWQVEGWQMRTYRPKEDS